jgi:SNF2 family DNA or RNA helicase
VYQFCGAYEDRFGLHTNGATNLLDLRDRLENIMVRRLADGNLPEITVQDIEVAHTEQVKAGWCLNIPSEPMATARRETAEAKMPVCISFIKDTLEEVDKVVVFFFHREIANRLMVGLEKYNPLIVIGGMAVKDKQETVDLFNKKKHKVFLLQINCAEGINGLQDTAHVGIFVEQEWSPSIVKQAVGRLSRHGQKHPVLIYNLVTQGGIEERIEKVLRKKEKIIGKLYE